MFVIEMFLPDLEKLVTNLRFLTSEWKVLYMSKNKLPKRIKKILWMVAISASVYLANTYIGI